MLYGLLSLSFWGYVIATLILTHVTIIAVTIYLHRHQAHRALELHPIVSHFFRMWLWLTTGMLTAEWVAIHRKHHATTETKDDPHSPQVVGLRKVLLEGAELYRDASRDREMMEKYSYGTPADAVECYVYTRYPMLGVVLMLFVDLALFGIPGITIWAIQMMCIPVCAAGIVNGVGHYWGYRNFESPDASTNVSPIGVFLGGEELHNNHHTFASSAKLSVKWFEFDIGWAYIRLLSLFGLAKVKKLPPKLVEQSDKSQIDVETLKAVVTNRFQIMAHYASSVIDPIVKAEKEQAPQEQRKLFRRAKVLLIRDDMMMNDASQERLARLLKENQTLQVVYQFRLKLQNIWSRTTHNQKELVDALQTWCRQAEAAGIDALRQFAKHMPTYVPMPAGE